MASVGEETLACRTRLCKIGIALLEDQLKVHKIVSAPRSFLGQAVQLLGDLVAESHDGNG